MAKLPQKDTLPELLAAQLNPSPQPFVDYLDAATIGHPCDRHIVYGYRHATKLPNAMPPVEKAMMVEVVKRAGMTVQPAVPAWPTPLWYPIDGIAYGVPDAPRAPHVLILDVAHTFDLIAASRGGVERACPDLYCLAQVLMKVCGHDRALYVAYGQQDRTIYAERLRYVPQDAAALLQRAEALAGTLDLPDRIGDVKHDACRNCIHADLCHGTQAPQPAMPLNITCRSCRHARRKASGWHCWKHDDKADYACKDHELNPSWVWFAQWDGEYYQSNGNAWSQNGDHRYTTEELTKLPAALVAAGTVGDVKATLDATVEDVK